MRILIRVFIAATIFALMFATPLEAKSSSTTLAIEPEAIRVPHLDLEQGFGRFSIDLRLSNVQNLKWFKFTIVFDGDVLAPIPREWHGDPSNWSGGGSSSGDTGYGSYVIKSYELKNPISGSGILLKFWFETRGAGTTKIDFREAELRDGNGDVIQCTFIGNEVEVLPFDTWLNEEYEKLHKKYDELQAQYTDLEAKHRTLSGEYGSLNSNYASLQEDHTSLRSRYDSLKEDNHSLELDYSYLEEDYASLSAEHTALKADYSSLESDYDELKLEHQSTVEQLEATKSQLNTTQMLLYGFIGFTAVLMGTVIFLLIRRRRVSN